MSPLDELAPDQRAVVQLVLQQGRSYDELAGMLGISPEAVRTRAQAGLAALAGRPEPSGDSPGRLSDFLLGQQGFSEREATRDLLEESPEARSWALAVADRLREVAPDALPEIPEEEAAAPAAEPEPPEPEPEPEPVDAEPADAEPDRPAPRPRPLRDREPAAAPPAVEPADAEEGKVDAAPATSSRLGGALLIGGLAILLAVLLVALLSGGDDDNGGNSTTAAATRTATSTTAQPQAVGQIPLRGPGDSKARGTMTIFTQNNQLGFTLEATNVPPSREGEAYAVWFANPGGSAKRLGFTQPVGEDGRLGLSGPRQEDLDEFPRWLTTYRQVVVSRETSEQANRPGPIVLRGTLPRGSS